jgi:HK97 gp10 family phage protein
MMDAINANVKDAINGLDELDKKLQRKGVRQSLRAAAKPTLKLAKSTAPVLTGRTQENVKLKSAGVKRGTFRMNVGIGKKWFTGPAFYSAFVAFGHKIGRRQLGNSRKQVAANDWLTKAYESTASRAVEIFRQNITDFIEENGK